MAVKKVEHVGIMVKDIEASIAFYRDIVGLDFLGTLDHPEPAIKLAFMGFKDTNQTEVELVQGYNDKLPQEGKVHHVAFTVDNIEEEYIRLKRLPVTFIDSEITTLPNGSRYIFFYGPDEEWIEIFEPSLTLGGSS